MSIRMIQGIALLVFLFISPIAYIILGRLAYRTGERLVLEKEATLTETIPLSAFFIFGVLLHVVVMFFLKLLQLPWAVAIFPPLIPALLCCREVKPLLAAFRESLSANYLLWFLITAGTGLSLFHVEDNISTAWTNNYGDLTFHLGMITSFVWGDNWPPQYHLFPGERLSYPMLMNVWTAAYFWICPTFKMLSIVFAAQWVYLWSSIYHLLRGNKYPLLPWALLFAGGSYFSIGHNSGELIKDNVSWTVFMTTVWVTQRTALFGVAASLGCLKVFHIALDFDPVDEFKKSKALILFSGVILALSPLVHAHILLVTGLYTMLVLFSYVATSSQNEDTEGLKLDFHLLLALMAPAACGALAFLPWITGKAHVTRWIFGWTTGLPGSTPPLGSLAASGLMWLTCAPAAIAAFFLVWFVTKEHRLFIPLLLIFIGANFLLLAEWDWDQLKVFIGVYVVLLAIWSHADSPRAYGAHFFCLALFLPGFIECFQIFYKGEMPEIYPKEKVERAALIREKTEPHTIIATAPQHHSLVTLTGRTLFYGYEGTLSSHGLNWLPRREVHSDINLLAKCKTLDDGRVRKEDCPQYLLWTDEEKTYWKMQTPPQPFQKTDLDFLYKFPS